MTDIDYVDPTLLANTPFRAEPWLYSLEPPTEDTGLYVNANKKRFIQEEVIFTFRGKPLKLEDQFTYSGYNILSSECDVNIRIGKVWIAIDRLSIIWKSDLSLK